MRRRGAAVAIAIATIVITSAGTSADATRFLLVKREIVERRLKQYEGDNQKREETLKRLFSEAGCDEQHLSEQPVKGAKQPNVVCVLPGQTGRVLIVGAHFDRTPDGDGVVDNWSGASLLPSLYEAVKSEARRHTYVFVGFTDEERGLAGSHFYARQMSKADVAATDAMLNMDSLGFGPHPGVD